MYEGVKYWAECGPVPACHIPRSSFSLMLSAVLWLLILWKRIGRIVSLSVSLPLPITININMSRSQENYKAMPLSPSESESFIPKTLSSVLSKRRRISEKLPLLGWLVALVILVIHAYGKVYPAKPTDLECTKKLNAWCKFFQGKGWLAWYLALFLF